MFDKESYEIQEFIEVTPFVLEHSGQAVVYIKLDVEWRFEGFEGEQTCHFDLVRNREQLAIDWFLC